MKSMLVAIRFSVLALLVLGATACPPTTVEPAPVDQVLPLTVNELCQIYLSRMANSDGLFGDPVMCYQRSLTMGTDYTEADLATQCRAGTEARVWVNELYDALRVGRVKMDWTQARECLDKTREMRRNNPGYTLMGNPEWKALESGVCKTFVQGGVADGQPCKLDYECGDGRGCYAQNPFDVNERKCQLPAAADETCTSYLPCASSAWCTAAGVCAAKAADGETCNANNYGDDCLSANCSDSNRCEPAPLLKELGEECTIDNEGYDDCNAPAGCVNCRPDSADGTNACRVLGGIGAYCRDWMDCVNDLGCKDNACSAEAAGTACTYGAGASSQLLCADGLYCLPTVASCSQYTTSQQCNSQTPQCGWDSQNSVCDFGEGLCYTEAEIPTSGSCLNGIACMPPSYCRPSDGTCQPAATENQPCSDTTGPPCASGFVCIDDVCRKSCDYTEDCQAGYYCAADYTCQPLAPTACGDDTMCPADFYCIVPDDPCAEQEEHICSKLELCKITPDPYCNPIGGCASLTTSGACSANAECLWITGDDPYCDNKCRAADGDPTGCAAIPTCSYYADYGACISECLYLWNDQTACQANTACVYVELAVCELKGPIGTCERKLAVGEICTESAECLSGDCATEESSGDMKCAVALSGCYRDASFLRSAFLLGLVFLGARGLRRWRKQ